MGMGILDLSVWIRRTRSIRAVDVLGMNVRRWIRDGTAARSSLRMPSAVRKVVALSSRARLTTRFRRAEIAAFPLDAVIRDYSLDGRRRSHWLSALLSEPTM